MPRDNSNPFVTVAGRDLPRVLVRTSEGEACVRVSFDLNPAAWVDLMFTSAQLRALADVAEASLPPPTPVILPPDYKSKPICDVCGSVEGNPHKKDCPLDPNTGGEGAPDANG